MVPGSTLMYGSSLMRVTLRPRDSRMAASDAEAMPLPREDTTPPVTNTNLVMTRASRLLAGGGKVDYKVRPSPPGLKGARRRCCARVAPSICQHAEDERALQRACAARHAGHGRDAEFLGTSGAVVVAGGVATALLVDHAGILVDPEVDQQGVVGTAIGHDGLDGHAVLDGCPLGRLNRG